MIDRLYEQRRILNDIKLDEKITNKDYASLLLNDHGWDILNQFSAFLKDFFEVTTSMFSKSYAFLLHIYPIVCDIIRRNTDVHSDGSRPVIRKAKESVFNDL